MRTPEQESLINELLFILPDFAVEFRRTAKWLAEARPSEGGSALLQRRNRANHIIETVRRITVDYDELKAEHARVSPLRTLRKRPKEEKMN